MKQPVPRVVVLDLDDTLYLERDFVMSGFSAVDQWLAEKLKIYGFASVAGRLFANGRRGDIFNVALEKLGLKPRKDFIDRLVGVYREHFPRIDLLDDAEAFIALPDPPWSLALLTDGHLVTQQNKIKALGLDRRSIAPIVCTGQWGRDFWKPHPRGFEHIHHHYGFSPSDYVYVADNPTKDFLSPRAMGWQTVRIIREMGIYSSFMADERHRADKVIRNFAELPTILSGNHSLPQN